MAKLESVLLNQLLACAACDKTDSVWVAYTCDLDASHNLILPPQPDGHPAQRICPSKPTMSCGGTSTGVVHSCVNPSCPQFGVIVSNL